MAEDDRVAVPVADIEIAAGSTWGTSDGQFFVANNSRFPIKVLAMQLQPPPPPPTCSDWLDIDADDCCTVQCDGPAGHDGNHYATVKDQRVEWWLTVG